MSDQSRKVFERLYRSAKTPQDLPWHREEPPELLVRALAGRDAPGTALDVGCGAGTYSLYLARRGFRVTAIDFMPQAVAMLRRRAAVDGLDIDAVEADITRWEPPHPYDVVLDVGCLHSLGGDMRRIYRSQLLKWLAPGGDFVLTHCGRRGWWDWWPIGPHRIRSDEITALFAPEVRLHSVDSELMTRMPLFMGRTALVDRYWFRRPP
ncbi:MAG: methyltransferase domain-containing protein [Gammaproteobacteria bacterium]|nr:methyltransferase domain-containing protein [Gammaproteobacteria bacterium]